MSRLALALTLMVKTTVIWLVVSCVLAASITGREIEDHEGTDDFRVNKGRNNETGTNIGARVCGIRFNVLGRGKLAATVAVVIILAEAFETAGIRIEGAGIRIIIFALSMILLVALLFHKQMR